MRQPSIRRGVRTRLVIFGILALLLILFSAFSAYLTPYDPYLQDLSQAKAPPSAEHLLGTNDLGQDIFSEMVYGTRVSLLLGVFSALLVSLIGTALALIAGYFGGTADKTICAVIDVTMAVPSLPLTMLLIALSFMRTPRSRCFCVG